MLLGLEIVKKRIKSRGRRVRGHTGHGLSKGELVRGVKVVQLRIE